ncbi:DUF4180 domain-containing protein [Nonomuraea sp. NPDC049784]|uniref:DUF4180 domain-containing protein n=1 Tax=Nonomuraea sp. NPDC049784 TaxID=3154361 RepID=UPI0033F364E6
MLDDRVYVCEPHGEPLREAGDALDLLGEAFGRGATWVAVPAERLHDDFFTLRTGVAGEIAQKFVNYRIGLAIVGDVSRFTAASSALRAWVLESNRGDHVWFVGDLAELAARRSAREHPAGDVDERRGEAAGPV